MHGFPILESYEWTIVNISTFHIIFKPQNTDHGVAN